MQDILGRINRIKISRKEDLQKINIILEELQIKYKFKLDFIYENCMYVTYYYSYAFIYDNEIGLVTGHGMDIKKISVDI